MISHTEWIDSEGCELARADLQQLCGTVLTARQHERAMFLLRYIDQVDTTFGPTTTGPLGLPARPLRCTYNRVRNGRLYSNAPRGPVKSGERHTYICTQGMPSALRPYLMRKWAHDLDIENCHVTLLYQMGASYHLWAEHTNKPAELHLPMLKRLYSDRSEFIEHIVEVHDLPTDESRYPGFRKTVAKELFLRILYGGKYISWLNDMGICVHNRSPRVNRLEREIQILRNAFLQSKRFSWLVDMERASQHQRGRLDDAVLRGTFSKIAQYLECTVLLSMRAYLLERGWNVLSLVFDGLTVCHDPNRTVDLKDMSKYIELDTQFCVNIVEKPLFMQALDKSSLLKV